MTITVTIKNDGPHAGCVIYYNKINQFKTEVSKLRVGESVTVNVWDGHLPVILPWESNECLQQFFAEPPRMVKALAAIEEYEREQ